MLQPYGAPNRVAEALNDYAVIGLAAIIPTFEVLVLPPSAVAVNTFGDAFYYTVVTLSTVGFGDILPVTAAGRWVTVATILAGIIVIPWQASKIVKEWGHKGKVNVMCPNCGLSYHDADASHCKPCGHVIYQDSTRGSERDCWTIGTVADRPTQSRCPRGSRGSVPAS